MTRQVAFACNIARPKARDTPRSGHPAPTSLPCQPSRFHLPAPHQANPPSGQHSATEQERAETARQGSLTVTFTARKSPVQATFHARQPAPAARRYLFQSSFHLRPTASASAARGASAASGACRLDARVSTPAKGLQTLATDSTLIPCMWWPPLKVICICKELTYIPKYRPIGQAQQGRPLL